MRRADRTLQAAFEAYQERELPQLKVDVCLQLVLGVLFFDASIA